MSDPITRNSLLEFLRWLITTHTAACILYYIISLIISIVLFRDEDRTLQPFHALSAIVLSPWVGGIAILILFFVGIGYALRSIIWGSGALIARGLEYIGRFADVVVGRITRREIQRDEAGILYESWFIGKRVRHVGVEDETGRHLVCVPPQALTALLGIAWSFGMRPEDYKKFLEGDIPNSIN